MELYTSALGAKILVGTGKFHRRGVSSELHSYKAESGKRYYRVGIAFIEAQTLK